MSWLSRKIENCLQDDQQQKSAEQSYLIEQIDYPFINDCDHPLQAHVQYGGGLSMSSDQSVQHYNMHENTNDRRNIGKLRKC